MYFISNVNPNYSNMEIKDSSQDVQKDSDQFKLYLKSAGFSSLGQRYVEAVGVKNPHGSSKMSFYHRYLYPAGSVVLMTMDQRN